VSVPQEKNSRSDGEPRPRSDSDGPHLSVHLALVAVQLMFAALSIAAKIAMREVPPLGLIAFRVPAATAILLIARAFMRWERVAWRDLPTLFVYALFGIIANQLIFIEGLARSTATNAVVIGATIPVFTVGVAVALGREAATRSKLVGLAVACGGALAIVGAGRFEAGGHLLGNLLIVTNSLCFSIYLVISRGLLARYRTITVITWTFVFGTLGVEPFGARALLTHAAGFSTRAWAALVFIVLFPTVGTYFLNTFALRRASSSLVAIYIYLQPAIGALLAAVMLGERPTAGTWIGGACIAIGIWLVTREARRRAMV
jgi:drug/metabolite transporter (DMT)-like permease